MSSERPINPRFEDDMWFNQVSPGPPRYRSRTERPVHYFTVVDKKDGVVLGYVWAADDDDAAAWEPRGDVGPRAHIEGGVWHAILEEAKERGTLPSVALSELYSDPDAGGKGRVLPGSFAEAANAGVVKALARGD
ncbi:hypothetical protein AB0C59_14085 [Streptomyces sp. NPDC048664]|uniref:hypothetical protein n=1 Tax=Streptomyces sp. NPDC048664 TaxID=3154505 RepID=UPI00342BDA17